MRVTFTTKKNILRDMKVIGFKSIQLIPRCGNTYAVEKIKSKNMCSLFFKFILSILENFQNELGTCIMLYIHTQTVEIINRKKSKVSCWNLRSDHITVM